MGGGGDDVAPPPHPALDPRLQSISLSVAFRADLSPLTPTPFTAAPSEYKQAAKEGAPAPAPAPAPAGAVRRYCTGKGWYADRQVSHTSGSSCRCTNLASLGLPVPSLEQ